MNKPFLKFGTGGLRGIMGDGPGQINEQTIAFVTQGLANVLLQIPSPHSVLIGFDSRLCSADFAKVAARVLAGNGIRAHLFSSLRPTPLISFGCLFKNCSAAIMITASHNPSYYNGYKVYWKDGAQIVEPLDKEIIRALDQIKSPQHIKQATFPHPLIQIENEDIDYAYLQTLSDYQNLPVQNALHGKDLKILYSNLHGAGITMVPSALKSWGFSSISFVEEQKEPDGRFPTVTSPNPEEKEALELGIRDLIKLKCDILFVTDPDADRMGVVVLKDGFPTILSGNQLAVILLYHLCNTFKKEGKPLASMGFITTIVTTPLFKEIVTSFQATCFEVLTGFKYIAAKMREHPLPFLFAAEESYGYLLGSFVRDKDGISASCLTAEAALSMKLQKKTLLDLLFEIYEKYGVYRESQLSLFFKGKEDLMTALRKSPPKEIAGIKFDKTIDYLQGVGELPKSDVLALHLQDGSRCIIRPSGTEPKLKIYLFTSCTSFSSVEEGIELCDTKLHAMSQFFHDYAK